MSQKYVEPVQPLELEVCPKFCAVYTQDSVICNEDHERCVMAVCPNCTKIVPRTPYCLNCGKPLKDAKRPYES